MKQLQEAEKELKRKQDDADQDMMMAGMVSDAGSRGKKMLSCQCKPSPAPLLPSQHWVQLVFSIFQILSGIACVRLVKELL